MDCYSGGYSETALDNGNKESRILFKLKLLYKHTKQAYLVHYI
jgi:hypothetical protein